MTSNVNQDSATILSLNYLAAIESRLGITWEANDTPVCVPDGFDASATKNLKAELDGILKGEPPRKALNATREYGKQYIQTVGFGLAADFDQFVKLGFLYGDRVVLWDFLSDRLLSEKSKISKMTLAQTACELLLLKPAVERGAVVILPHPMEWSGLAEMVAEDLQQQGVRSTAVFGLSMALSAVEEGLNLHPFTMLRSEPQPKPSSAVSGYEGDFYSKENYIFQNALSQMLSNQQFAYLQNISSAEFQRIVAEHKELRRELRKLFNPTPGLSRQQLAAEQKSLQSDLSGLIKKQNDAIFKYNAERSEANVVLTASLLTKLHAATFGKTGIADICVRLAIALRKWFNKPGKNTIVQAFQALQRQEARDLVEQLHQHERRPGLAASVQVNSRGTDQTPVNNNQEFEAARRGFWAAGPWTEGMHEYLMSLPIHLAVKILRSLTSGERQRLVNVRRFQEAYIADYIGDLWGIDKTSFWKHLETMFKSPEGMIVSDCNDHLDVMSSENMPSYVWSAFLRCLLKIEIVGSTGIGGYFTESYSEILSFQTTQASERKQRREEFCSWFQTLTHKKRDLILTFLRNTFHNKVPVWVRRQPMARSGSSGHPERH